jgi:hypothetical protein
MTLGIHDDAERQNTRAVASTGGPPGSQLCSVRISLHLAACRLQTQAYKHETMTREHLLRAKKCFTIQLNLNNTSMTHSLALNSVVTDLILIRKGFPVGLSTEYPNTLIHLIQCNGWIR